MKKSLLEKKDIERNVTFRKSLEELFSTMSELKENFTDVKSK